MPRVNGSLRRLNHGAGFGQEKDGPLAVPAAPYVIVTEKRPDSSDAMESVFRVTYMHVLRPYVRRDSRRAGILEVKAGTINWRPIQTGIDNDKQSRSTQCRKQANDAKNSC